MLKLAGVKIEMYMFLNLNKLKELMHYVIVSIWACKLRPKNRQNNNPTNPTLLFQINTAPYGDGANSVALHEGIVAVAAC